MVPGPGAHSTPAQEPAGFGDQRPEVLATMPSRPTRVPDGLDAGYRKFQRRVARTTERTDLNRVLPGFSRRARGRASELRRSISLPAVLAAGGVIVVVVAIFVGLGRTGGDAARLAGPVTIDDTRPVNLQVSGGFQVEGAFTREPDPLADPNMAGGSTDPFSRLFGGGAGVGSSGSGDAGSGGSGTAGSSEHTGEAGAPVGILSNPELVRLFYSTNLARTTRGLQPLILDTSLTRSAQRHATWMAERGVLCHSSECDVAGQPDPSLWNGWSENIAYSAEPTDFVLFNAFKNSPPHFANMLDPRHRYIGLGWAPGYLAGTDRVRVFTAVQFGMQRR